ncbi:hypothetical protein ABK040_012327 [Willaertia magna]
MSVSPITHKYMAEALFFAKKALQIEQTSCPSNIIHEYYLKASNSINCAISFETNEALKQIYQYLNQTYERKLSQLDQDASNQMQLKSNLPILRKEAIEEYPNNTTPQQKQNITNFNCPNCRKTLVVSVMEEEPKSSGIITPIEGNKKRKRMTSEDISLSSTNEIKIRDPITFSTTDNTFSDQISSNQSTDSVLTTEERKIEGNPNFQTSSNSKIEKCILSDQLRQSIKISYQDIIGLEDALQSIREATLLPLKFPQLFQGELKAWKSILLYGPPGTGKTLLASALASETNSTFFNISSADLLSKWVGQSEQRIKQMFEMAHQRRPSIIFIDEIDSLCGARNDSESETARRIKTEFLVQMQGIYQKEGILIIGATNLPWELDIAIKRRFEKKLYIPLPNEESRVKMIRKYLGQTEHILTNEHFQELGEKTKGFSGSDILILTRQALMEPLRKCQRAIKFKMVSGISPVSGLYYDDLLTPITEEEKFSYNHNYCLDTDIILEVKLFDIDQEKLLPPFVDVNDFRKALETIHCTATKEDEEKYDLFSKTF